MPRSAPVYIKHTDLPTRVGVNIHIQLCDLFAHHVPGQLLQAQLVRGIWTISLKTEHAQKFMVGKVKTLRIGYQDIELHDHYPTTKTIPNEKIIFKDLPYDVNNAEIIDFLKNQPGIYVKSDVISARIRDNSNNLTQYYSGDRYV